MSRSSGRSRRILRFLESCHWNCVNRSKDRWWTPWPPSGVLGRDDRNQGPSPTFETRNLFVYCLPPPHRSSNVRRNRTYVGVSRTRMIYEPSPTPKPGGLETSVCPTRVPRSVKTLQTAGHHHPDTRTTQRKTLCGSVIQEATTTPSPGIPVTTPATTTPLLRDDWSECKGSGA